MLGWCKDIEVAHSTSLFPTTSTGVHSSKFAPGIAALLEGVSKVIGNIPTTFAYKWHMLEHRKDHDTPSCE